ncbi:hypothetical protein EVAR_33217_1 [Eumeta japonica]|uniref:Uncharacterized protein n=1 Tax=Eumeta variegata TaxID=151549 RepID=A0A4C1W3H9_EUMVA|nr:hypothetical protein EVAR_33217_1 [Eumeta japonica]
MRNKQWNTEALSTFGHLGPEPAPVCSGRQNSPCYRLHINKGQSCPTKLCVIGNNVGLLYSCDDCLCGIRTGGKVKTTYLRLGFQCLRYLYVENMYYSHNRTDIFVSPSDRRVAYSHPPGESALGLGLTLIRRKQLAAIVAADRGGRRPPRSSELGRALRLRSHATAADSGAL